MQRISKKILQKISPFILEKLEINDDLANGWTGKSVSQKKKKKEYYNEIIDQIQTFVFNEYLKNAADYHLWKSLKSLHPLKVIIRENHYEEKKKDFKLQINKSNFNEVNIVYLFLGTRNTSIYVGRSSKGINRIITHFDKIWFQEVKAIHIIPVKYRRDLPKTECLLTHFHEPKQNKNFPSLLRYTSSCPVCDLYREVENITRKIIE